MDELTELTATLQHHLGPELEMVFGHGNHPAAAGDGLRVWLLVGYGQPQPAAPPKASPTVIPPPPDATGRDAAFVPAAELLVARQQANSSLLQRVLKLGYNRSCRLMDQLTADGIIGPPGPAAGR